MSAKSLSDGHDLGGSFAGLMELVDGNLPGGHALYEDGRRDRVSGHDLTFAITSRSVDDGIKHSRVSLYEYSGHSARYSGSFGINPPDYCVHPPMRDSILAQDYPSHK